MMDVSVRGRAALFCIWFITAAGCTRTGGDACEAQGGCGGSQECVDGVCRNVCNNSADCTATERCVDGACLPDTRTSSSSGAVSGPTSMSMSGGASTSRGASSSRSGSSASVASSSSSSSSSSSGGASSAAGPSSTMVDLCGNNAVDVGETCDGNCPTTCNDMNACTDDMALGSPDLCTLECLNMAITDCGGADGCCPPGCEGNDPDCSTTCGNGMVDPPLETCDGNCPTACADMDACTADVLTGSAAACNAACSNTPITRCTSDDGCCPAGCNRNVDTDCMPVCGNNAVESGELCDGNCPTACNDGNACTADVLTGQGCTAACATVAITACVAGDGCCAPGCDNTEDADCMPVCGNNVVESGETCDGNCPATCNDGNVCTTDVRSGSGCNVTCQNNAIMACAGGDGCCAPGCNSNNDADCMGVCGNSEVEGGELCDGNCPTAATCNDMNACTTDTVTGAACTRACSNVPITTCVNNDGCCAPGCNANNDNNCMPSCGNNVVESGEACDGNCPTACNDMNACTTDLLAGLQCGRMCTFTPITACANNDGCCAPGCNANNDNNCMPMCGNGVVEGTEVCDGSCPTSCNDGNACTSDVLQGTACSRACAFNPITMCINGDGCCPAGCNANNDNNCSPMCGNGVVESGETCDGNCPTSCDDGNACTTNTLTGAACTRACTYPAITTCTNSDGCCPATCNAANDNNCSPVCPNGVVEPGETCDGNCPSSCNDMNACTADTLNGAACTRTCSNTPITMCTGGDGCCPAGCSRLTDADCPAPKPLCWGPNATGRIGNGGTATTLNPVDLVLPPGVTHFLAMDSSNGHTCAIGDNQRLYCWGSGYSGQLGTGNTNSSNVPVAVSSSLSFTAVAVGSAHSCALADNQDLYCWGNNSSGEVGIGNTTSPQNAPRLVGGGYKAVSAGGGSHTCAINASDRVVCWGSNTSGQLGDGTNNPRNSPRLTNMPGGVTTFLAVSAGPLNSCAVGNNNRVYCWGYNSAGAVGDGSFTNNRQSPTQVLLPSGAYTRVSAGYTGCAISSTGVAYCWGANSTGQVGDGTTTPGTPFGINMPRTVSLARPALDIEADGPCARQDDGRLMCWGGMRGPLPAEVPGINQVVALGGYACAMGNRLPLACAGYETPTGCYFQGGFGADCDATCAGLGGCNPAATQALGGGGTDNQCSAVDQAFGGTGGATSPGTGDTGCSTQLEGLPYSPYTVLYRYGGTTTCAGGAPLGVRYCGCGP